MYKIFYCKNYVDDIVVYMEVTGLVSTQFLMFGIFPTLSTRLASLGKLLRTLLSGRSLIYMKVWRSAQVKLFPTKNCPPRLASLVSSCPRAVGTVTGMILLTSLVLGEEQFYPGVDEVLDDINDLIHLCRLH